MATFLLAVMSLFAHIRAMTDLKSYLKDNKMTLASLARQIGISYSYMHEIATFKKRPSYDVAMDIHEATGGKIPFGYWRKRSEEQSQGT